MIALVLAAAVTFPQPETDPRYELLAVVQLLAGADTRYSGFFRHPTPYDALAEERFAPFKRHPAVSAWSAMAAKGLDPQFFHDFMLTLSPPPELAPLAPFNHGALPRAGGAEAVETLRLLLGDFARASRFDDFWKETEEERASWVRQVSKQAKALKLKEAVEDYTGMPVELGYRVILSPWTEPALAGAVVQDGAIVSVYGQELIDGVTQYRLPTRRGGLWRAVIFEQLAPAALEHRPEARRSQALYGPLHGGCAPTWVECARREISFAAAARMLERAGELQTAREWPVKYARMGMPHLPVLVEELRAYEADRKTYKTLADFYPRLLAALEKAAPVKVPFAGGIKEALSDPRVLIVRKGDPWLERNWEALRLPLTLTPGKLVFHERFAQEPLAPVEGDVSLASVALHPEDPSRPVVIYTGRKYEGPADYVVFVGTAAVRIGSYERSRIPWRLK